MFVKYFQLKLILLYWEEKKSMKLSFIGNSLNAKIKPPSNSDTYFYTYLFIYFWKGIISVSLKKEHGHKHSYIIEF